MYELFDKGGPVMWPLLAASFIAMAIVLERLLFWAQFGLRRSSSELAELFKLTEEGKFASAIKLGRNSKCNAVRILEAGLQNRDYGFAGSMKSAAESEIERMKKGLATLDTIITLSPLMGILGTVSGIIVSFDLLGQSGIANPKAVTGGISQALITTAAGLTIAIVTLIPYNAFRHKTVKQTKRLEKLLTQFEIAFQKGISSAETSTGKGSDQS